MVLDHHQPKKTRLMHYHLLLSFKNKSVSFLKLIILVILRSNLIVSVYKMLQGLLSIGLTLACFAEFPRLIMLIDFSEMAFRVLCKLPDSFIHSGYFYIASSSPLLLRGAPDTAQILCRSFTPKRHRQLRVKDLPKVPTWRPERDSNPRHFGRKAKNLPLSHHAPIKDYPLTYYCIGS